LTESIEKIEHAILTAAPLPCHISEDRPAHPYVASRANAMARDRHTTTRRATTFPRPSLSGVYTPKELFFPNASTCSHLQTPPFRSYCPFRHFHPPSSTMELITPTPPPPNPFAGPPSYSLGGPGPEGVVYDEWFRPYTESGRPIQAVGRRSRIPPWPRKVDDA
jgi:hypothetical protein